MVVKSPDCPARMPSASLVAKIGFLVWMLGMTLLYWLIHGPGSKLVGSRLVILHRAREFLLQFFYHDYIF